MGESLGGFDNVRTLMTHRRVQCSHMWMLNASSLKKGGGEPGHEVTETVDRLSRGKRGVGILWKKSFDAIPILDIQSDRICGNRIEKGRDEETWISHHWCLLFLSRFGSGALPWVRHWAIETVISESEQWGPVIIAGEFNDHLCPQSTQESPLSKGSCLMRRPTLTVVSGGINQHSTLAVASTSHIDKDVVHHSQCIPRDVDNIKQYSLGQT